LDTRLREVAALLSPLILPGKQMLFQGSLAPD